MAMTVICRAFEAKVNEQAKPTPPTDRDAAIGAGKLPVPVTAIDSD
jgi:hypothetical protein